MVSAISQYGVLYDSNGILIDRGSTIGNDSQSLTLNQRKCLTEVLLQKKIDDEDFLKRTVFETLIQLAAVRQTFKVSLADTTLGSANLFISWSAVSSRIPLHYVADYSLLRIVNHNDDQRAESVLLPVTYSSLCTCTKKFFCLFAGRQEFVGWTEEDRVQSLGILIAPATLFHCLCPGKKTRNEWRKKRKNEMRMYRNDPMHPSGNPSVKITTYAFGSFSPSFLPFDSHLILIHLHFLLVRLSTTWTVDLCPQDT